jgi:hypothetical protein
MFWKRIGLLGAACLAALVGCGGRGSKAVKPIVNRPLVQEGLLSGRFTDRTTSLPLVQAEVLAQDATRPILLARTITNADGSYTLSRLPVGVPLRVVSQPLGGAVAYGAEVSGPVTLTRDGVAPKVDLAFAPVESTGKIEGTLVSRTNRPRSVFLLQKRDLGGGASVRIVVRAIRTQADGRFSLDQVVPGDYELKVRAGGPRPGRGAGHRRGKGGGMRSLALTVRASETFHVRAEALTRHGLASADQEPGWAGEAAQEDGLPQ